MRGSGTSCRGVSLAGRLAMGRYDGLLHRGDQIVEQARFWETAFDIDGRTATVYFECHFFNVAIDPGPASLCGRRQAT
jgi:hypothetical protein